MLSNPFSRPTRTIIVIIFFLLAGSLYYRPVHHLPNSVFPRLDTNSLHRLLNASDHGKVTRSFMSKLQKPLQEVKCPAKTTIVSSLQHHYRTQTQIKTVSFTATSTQIVQPTCEAVFDKYSSTIATAEQRSIAKLRDAGIVVIFKTGAQEVSHLAIQVGTTLRYLSPDDILFFSDQQGSIGPFAITDALRNVDQKMKNDEPDFEIYRQIKKYQSTGQDVLELQDDKRKGQDRSGWKLDKYKFIHIVEESFEMRPNAKWYVFIETDSYVFWDNLAEWLGRLDSSLPWYIGSGVNIGGITFAHGGSGYVLSNAAMVKLLGPEQPQGLAAEWDTRMGTVPYGDLALAIALREKDVNLTIAHPLLNGYKPSTFTYGPNNHWCQAVVTMHHVLPNEVSSTWRYERKRESLGMANATIFADLYHHFVDPHLVDLRDNWDNLSHGKEYSQRLVDERKKKKDLRDKKEKEEKEKKDAVEKEKRLKVEGERKLLKEEADAEQAKLEKTSAEKANAEKQSTDEATTEKEKTEKTEIEKAKSEERVVDDTAESKDDVPDADELAEKPDQESLNSADAAKEVDDNKKIADPNTRSTFVIDRVATDKAEDMVLDRKKHEEEERARNKAGNESNDEERAKIKARGMNDKRDINTIHPNNTTTEPKDRSAQQTKVEKLKEDPPEEKFTEAQLHAHESFNNCKKVCEENPECFQWVYASDNKVCKLGFSFRLGKYMKPDKEKVIWKSGWLVKRVKTWTTSNVCTNVDWLNLSKP